MDKAEGEITPQESLAVTLLRNIRYHEDRQDFFALVNRVFNFAVLMSGTAVVTTLAHADKPGVTPTVFATGTTVISAVQLIWDPGQKQFLHESLRTRFLDLLADLSSGNVAEVRMRAAKLYSSEPPTYYAVDALAFNAAQKAQERPDTTLIAVDFWQRRTRNLIRFTSTKFVSLGDIPPRRWRWHWPLERG